MCKYYSMHFYITSEIIKFTLLNALKYHNSQVIISINYAILLLE